MTHRSTSPGIAVGTMNAAREEMEKEWRLARWLRGGTLEMREPDALQEMLPRDKNEGTDDYRRRVLRSVLFAAYDDTIQKTAGKPFERPVSTTEELLDENLRPILINADKQGSDLTQFCRRVFEDAVDRGLSHILVNHPDTRKRDGDGNILMRDGEVMTMDLAEETNAGVRPYWTHIRADQVLWWHKIALPDGTDTLESVAWVERSTERTGAFGEVAIERVWVWTRDTWQVWRREFSGHPDNMDRFSAEKQQAATQFVPEGDPTRHGLGRVPLSTVYTNRTGFMTARAPFADLLHLNIAHWQSDSQQRTFLHWARAFIPFFKGLSEEDIQNNRIRIGPGWAIKSAGENADGKIIEVSGASLEAGRNDLESLEDRMEVLGLQPFIETTGRQTARGKVIDQNDKQSRVQSWAEAMEQAIFDAWFNSHLWRGLEMHPDFSSTVWRDFEARIGRSSDVPLLQADADKGRIPREVYLREAKRRGLYSDDLDIEATVAEANAEREEIAAMFMTQLPAPDDGEEPEMGQENEG